MTDMTCSRRSFAKGVACASACAVAGGLGLSGCGGDSAGEAGSSDAKAASYKIGVLQLTEHPALDAANKGFVEAIELPTSTPRSTSRMRRTTSPLARPSRARS